MYFDEDGDLAHEFYEEVLPRYEISSAFDVVTILTKQEKGWQEKNAKNWEESQVHPFVSCLNSILGVCHDVLSTYLCPGHREKWNTVCRVFTSTSQSFFIRTETSFKGFWTKWYNGTLPIALIITAPLKVCLKVVMIKSRPLKRQKTKSEDNLSHPEPLDFILCAQYSLKWIVQLYCSTHFASVIITIIGWPRRYQNKRASNIYAARF